VLSLQSIFREEIAVIGALKRHLPQLEIWLAHTDGRQAALAEAMRLGADGLLGEDGLHRIASAHAAGDGPPVSALLGAAPAPTPPAPVHLPQSPLTESNEETQAEHHEDEDASVSEPVLTADELRALLQEQPSMPPSGGNDN
jgi:hypothetical protein